MTVRELIAELMKQPQDAVAVVNLTKNELANGMTVSTVELCDTLKDSCPNYRMNYYPEIWEEDDGEQVKVVNISA